MSKSVVKRCLKLSNLSEEELERILELQVEDCLLYTSDAADE